MRRARAECGAEGQVRSEVPRGECGGRVRSAAPSGECGGACQKGGMVGFAWRARRARAEGECGGRVRSAAPSGECGGRVRRASAEGERGVPMKSPPLSGGLVSVRSEAASVASGHTRH